jgi:hypothetical protein
VRGFLQDDSVSSQVRVQSEEFFSAKMQVTELSFFQEEHELAKETSPKAIIELKIITKRLTI